MTGLVTPTQTSRWLKVMKKDESPKMFNPDQVLGHSSKPITFKIPFQFPWGDRVDELKPRTMTDGNFNYFTFTVQDSCSSIC